MATTGKRVLMLLENYHFPGDGRVRREALTLTKAGYTVTVICQRKGKQPWVECYEAIHVYRYPKPPTAPGFWGYLAEYGYSLAAALVLSLVVLVRRGFDVIHAHNPPDLYVLLALLYRPLGKRFVYDHHDLAPEMYEVMYGGEGRPLLHKALLWFERLSLRTADQVITTSESYKQLEMARAGLPAERITVVRNGPEPQRIHPVAPDTTLRPPACTLLGYVGDMGRHDGLDYLLRALHHLVHTHHRTDFRCLIIGTGDMWDELQALAAALQLTPYVHFTGWVNDETLLRYLASVDICLDPDPRNAFSDRSSMIKMTEYMALGKPIVAFDLTEHRVTAQDAARYARANDEADFAGRIAELMDDPTERARMGQVGRQRVENELAWPWQEKHLLNAYARLTDQQTTSTLSSTSQAGASIIHESHHR
jgi:glycosyltransferase involved in cell wall biosynthesis